MMKHKKMLKLCSSRSFQIRQDQQLQAGCCPDIIIIVKYLKHTSNFVWWLESQRIFVNQI